MNSRKLRLTVGALAWLLTSGCTPDRDPGSLFAPGQIDVPVVDALLIIDQPLPQILLSRTVAPDQPYTFEAAAIRDADVRVVIAGNDTVRYAEEAFFPGVYYPTAAEPPLVLASTVYELLVDTVEQEQIYAATTTPAPLVIDQWVLMDRDGLNDLRTLRTSPSFGGGFQFGGNAGDGFERPIFRVSGGIGLFGSAAMDSIGFTVLPLPQP